jgi:bifunctional DNase/RNase
MSLIQLRVNRITYSQNQSGAYAMILDEVDGNRKLPVVIGEFEAQSIACITCLILFGATPNPRKRPLTSHIVM